MQTKERLSHQLNSYEVRIKGKSRDRVIQETQPSAPAAGTGTAAPVRPYIGNCLYKWLDIANIRKSLSKKTSENPYLNNIRKSLYVVLSKLYRATTCGVLCITHPAGSIFPRPTALERRSARIPVGPDRGRAWVRAYKSISRTPII